MTEAAAAFARARERAPWIGWILAFALPLAMAMALTRFENSILFPGSLSIAIVLLAALLGGVWAGITATGCAAVALWWGALAERGSFTLEHPRDVIGLAVMATCGAGTSLIVRWLDRAQADAGATARLLDALLRYAPSGFAYFDRHLRIVLCNEAFGAVTGLPEGDHAGRDAATVPALGAVGRGHLRRVLAERESLRGVELAVPVEGEPHATRHLLANYYPVFDTRRRIVGLGMTVSDVTATRTHLELEQLARAEAERLSHQLEALQFVTDVALGQLPLDALLDEVMQRVRAILAVDAVRIQLVLPGDRLGGGGSIGLEAEVDLAIDTPIGVGVSGHIAVSDEPVVIEDLAHVEISSPVLAASGLTSLAGVALRSHDRLVGVMHVATFERRTFSSEDLDLLCLAAERVATAIERTQTTERERTTARTLQASLLPRAMPPVAELEIAAYYEPAGANIEVGGDFYDAVVCDGSYAVFIGDVSGKGIEAAALTSAARHTLRAAARHVEQPSLVLRWLDDALKEYPSDLYVTACFGRFARDADGATFTFALGGHPRPVLRRADGRTGLVGTAGSLIGIIEGPRFADTRVALAPGDTIVLYTDGVTDVPGAAGMTDEELRATVAATAGLDPAATIDALAAAIAARRTFEQRIDDTALVVLRVPA